MLTTAVNWEAWGDCGGRPQVLPPAEFYRSMLGTRAGAPADRRGGENGPLAAFIPHSAGVKIVEFGSLRSSAEIHPAEWRRIASGRLSMATVLVVDDSALDRRLAAGCSRRSDCT